VPNWTRKLEEAWRLAESTHPGFEQGIVMEDIALVLPEGHVRAGADASGFRHLLIPLQTEAQVDGLFDGKSILLKRRPLVVDGSTTNFAALTCTQAELFPEFTTLVADVVSALEAHPPDLLTAVEAVLSDWRELLRVLGGRGLDRNAVTGLYGELFLLEQIVRLDPLRRSDCWTGPDAARHDFQRGAVALEVKTTCVRHGRTFTVHGLDQLGAPSNATLFLYWSRLELAVDRGDSLRSLVNRLLDIVSDTAEFNRKLEGIDYRPQGPDDYTSPRFTVLENFMYRVDGDFPRLMEESFVDGRLPRGVTGVSYQVDLASETALSEPEAENTIRQLAGC
jgi:hypothetical protein